MNGWVTKEAPKGAGARSWIKLGTFGVVACGVCCAVPLLGLIGGGTAVTALGWQVEGIVGAAIAGTLALGAGVWIWRRRQACRVPASPTPQNRTR